MRPVIHRLSIIFLAQGLLLSDAVIAKVRTPSVNSRTSARLERFEKTLKALSARPTFTDEQFRYLAQTYDSRIDFGRLASFPTQIEGKLAVSESANKTAIADLKSDLTKEEKSLSDSILSFSNSWTNIFLTLLTILLTILGLVSGAATYFIKNSVVRRVLKQSKKDASAFVRSASLITIAEAHSELIAPFWKLYEEKYQAYLAGNRRIKVDDFEHNLLIALGLSKNGLESLSKDRIDSDYKDNALALFVYAKLINHFVYHETAYLLCRPQCRDFQSRRDEVIQRAEYCISLGRDRRLLRPDFDWYNYQETGATTLSKLGNEGSQIQGREIISKIFNGSTPGEGFQPPPSEWLKWIWDDYSKSNPIAVSGIARPT